MLLKERGRKKRKKRFFFCKVKPNNRSVLNLETLFFTFLLTEVFLCEVGGKTIVHASFKFKERKEATLKNEYIIFKNKLTLIK